MQPNSPKVFISLLLLLTMLNLAQKPLDSRVERSNIDPEQHYALMAVNNLSLWVSSDGRIGNTPSGNIVGGGFGPENLSVLYADGLNWGGLMGSGTIEDRLRVGGQQYRAPVQPGWIVSPGRNGQPPIAIAADDPRARIYSVRRDYQQLSVNNPAIIRQAAGYFDVAESAVNDSMASVVIQRFEKDWQQWPADLGAPFTDINGNGLYDWETDIAGYKDADQTIWLVYNDLDSLQTLETYDSPPLGLEVQLTLWAYKTAQEEEAVVFKNYRIENKSGVAIDSFYVGQWSDIDLGGFTDDLIGCDSLLQAGFSYNGGGEDTYFATRSLRTPAVGYQFLKGRSSTNNPLHTRSVIYFGPGSAIADPCLSGQCYKEALWNTLRGYEPNNRINNPIPFYHLSGPQTGSRTLFPLNGDAKFGTGDIDGEGGNFQPGDRRMLMAFDPFLLAADSSCDLMLTFAVASGDNYLNSIDELKRTMRSAKARISTENESFPEVPRFSSRSGWPTNQGTAILFSAEAVTAQDITLILRSYAGDSLTTIDLVDDGSGIDEVANDGIFSAKWLAQPDSFGLSADVRVRYNNGFEYRWRRLGERVTTVGRVRAAAVTIGSENLLRDNALNNGENIRITFALDNQSLASVKNAILTAGFVKDASLQRIEWIPARKRLKIGRSGSYSWQYSSVDTFYVINGDESLFDGSQLPIVISIADHHDNLWIDTLSIPVATPAEEPRAYLTERTAGPRTGDLGYQIVDPSQLTGDEYEVEFYQKDSLLEPLFRLINVTNGATLLEDQPFPDDLGHNTQLVDGFQISPGKASLRDSSAWQWLPEGSLWISLIGPYPGGGFYHSAPIDSILTDIKIIFDPAYKTNAVVAERNGDQYLGAGIFPGAVFDIRDPLHPRRITLSFYEADSVSNLRWGLIENNQYSDQWLEMLSIINEDYDPTRAQRSTIFADSETHWSFQGYIPDDHRFMESSGELNVSYRFGVSPGNRYRFTPQYVEISNSPPKTFRLEQNFPNPFNPFTTIRFHLESAAETELTIYNILGQQVRTWNFGNLRAGGHQTIWNGRNDSGKSVASGIYIYRLVLQNGSAMTRKMVLLR